jgi:hypothetical protein
MILKTLVLVILWSAWLFNTCTEKLKNIREPGFGKKEKPG